MANQQEGVEDSKLTRGMRRLLELKKRNARGRVTFYLEKGEAVSAVGEIEVVEKE